MLKNYFKQLYTRTMNEAYGCASRELISFLSQGGECLDCGAGDGVWYQRLSEKVGLPSHMYHGVEWNHECVLAAQEKGISVVHGDLNKKLPFDGNKFSCVFGFSVLEHLLNPCSFLKESYRVLSLGGRLILLTPNISTYFTAALILAGKMPSSGPHPDSNHILESEEVFRVSAECFRSVEGDAPVHRHLIVFSYKVLKKYLKDLGFRDVRGYGFGLYPFPNFSQPFLEKLDPYHCHQMVFVAVK